MYTSTCIINTILFSLAVAQCFVFLGPASTASTGAWMTLRHISCQWVLHAGNGNLVSDEGNDFRPKVLGNLTPRSDTVSQPTAASRAASSRVDLKELFDSMATGRDAVNFIHKCSKQNEKISPSQLAVLTDILKQSRTPLTMIEISMGLNALKLYKHLYVKDLLIVMERRIKESAPKFSSQAVGNALYGLQKMTSESPEVRRVLDALVPKVLYL